MVARGGRSGCSSANLFTFSVNLSTLSCESVSLSVVSSTVAKSCLSTSGLSYFARFSATRACTSLLTCSSSRLRLYLLNASSYLLGIASGRLIFNSIVSFYTFNLGLLMWRVASRFVFFSKLHCMACVRSTPV